MSNPKPELPPVPKWTLDYLESLAQVLGDIEEATAGLDARVQELEHKVRDLEREANRGASPANGMRYECPNCHGVLFAAKQAGSLMCPCCPGWAMYATKLTEPPRYADQQRMDAHEDVEARHAALHVGPSQCQPAATPAALPGVPPVGAP